MSVSHKYVPRKYKYSIAPCKDDFTEIEFSISVSQGRLLVEPGTFSARRSLLRWDPENWTTAWDSTTTYENMCFCKVVSLATENRSVNVVGWVKDYVNVVLQSGVVLRNDPPHCWQCAGHMVI